MKHRRTADDFVADMKAKLNARIAAIPVPARMLHLPISDQGFPTPWFVARFQGEYDFRVADQQKLGYAIKRKLCWLCGQPLGKFMCFVIGPMCAVNRVTSEPPSHRECAEYAAKACPFLTQPKMRRNEKELPDERIAPGGVTIPRNPGCVVLWITTEYETFKPEAGNPGMLIRIGKAHEVYYYCEGRPATRGEVLQSIDSGMPLLARVAKLQGLEYELDQQYKNALQMLPAA